MLNLSELRVPTHFITRFISPACKGNEAIINAFMSTPRAFFLDEAMTQKAYTDDALPIGFGQTISQPSLVALILQELEIKSSVKCLEVGSGCGFVAALLGRLADEVYGLEIIPELYEKARKKIRALMLNNVKILLSDGVLGYPEKMPYDRIVVSAGAKNIPQSLTAQLADDGIMLIPVNGILKKITKTDGCITEKAIAKVAFVDFVGA